jgi:hypothetical protein
MNKQLAIYLDGLDAATDGRGYGEEHERARLFVEGACAMVETLANHSLSPRDVDNTVGLAACICKAHQLSKGSN